MRRAWLVLPLIVLICPAVGAGEEDQAPPWATTVTYTVAAELEDANMPNEEGPVSKTLTFPAIERKEGQLPVLRFRARMHWPRPGGCANTLGVALNDREFGAVTDGETQRLINRCRRLTWFNDKKKREVKSYWWGKRDKTTKLRAFYGPGGEVIDERLHSNRNELYWYVLDISDAVKYKGEGANKLVLTSYKLLTKNRQLPMIVEDITVGYIPVAEWRSRLESYKEKD